MWLASWVKNIDFPHIWMRFVLVLWTFGCYQYSWLTLHKAYPWWSYVALLNPMTYAFESTRAAVLGHVGLLPFWASCAALWFFIALFFWHALCLFKKRLDYV